MNSVFRNLFNAEILPDTVYHYTNGSAFLGIVQNKELWASHIRFQNDKTEAIYSLGILREVLEEEKEIFVQKGFDIEKILSFTSSFTGLATFTLSFSGKKDDLNQWRSYANTTPSYCIGFSTALLRQIIIENKKEKVSDVKSITETLFAKCIYKRDIQKSIIENIINHVMKTEIVKGKYIEEGIAGLIMQDFLPISAFFKHPSFEEEDEYRLMFSPVKNDKINIRIGKNGFIPYVKVPFSEDCLRDIIIAPCPDEKHIFDSTLYVCMHSGIEFCKSTGRTIENSIVPYRQ